jgi:undecaprenyl diphosphate synthase
MMQSKLHVAVIMDGNGRWALGRGLPRIMGHRAGAEALRRIVEAASDCGVGVLTVYAFSSDNWKRPKREVEALMALLGHYLSSETERCFANGVRMSIIGRRDRLPDDLRESIDSAERATRQCDLLHLRLAIDYSARDAIVAASNSAASCSAASAQITRQRFEELLGGIQPVDILIRTGGEQRLSDFLLWECAYAELIFTRQMWPDFSPCDLEKAVEQCARRERRFGGIPPAPVSTQEHWLR